MIPTAVRTTLAVVISLAVLGGFVGQVIWVAIRTYKATNQPPAFSEPFLYVAALLVGLVGATVAIGLGVKPPEEPQSNPEVRSRIARQMASLGGATTTSKAGKNWQIWVGSIYAVVYVLVGLFTIAVWLMKTDLAPDLIKSMALTSIGVFLPVARGFLQGPS